MRRSFTSEWLKLRRRGMLAALATVIAITGLVTFLTISRAGATGRGPGDHAFLSLAAARGAGGLALVIGRAGGLLGIVALAVFASTFATEFSQGTLRNLLVREPRRPHLLAGKYLALTSAAAGAVLLAIIVNVPVALAAAAGKAIPTTAWFTGTGLADLARTGVNLCLAIIGWGTLGTLLAVILRSPASAIGVGVAYALPLEGILSSVVHGLNRWLPGQLLDTLAAGGNATASYTAATLTLLAYGALAATLAAVLFTRRDVAT
jgi:ABC-2 type transport system permease protein